jgi:hypothetical protein
MPDPCDVGDDRVRCLVGRPEQNPNGRNEAYKVTYTGCGDRAVEGLFWARKPAQWDHHRSAVQIRNGT